MSNFASCILQYRAIIGIDSEWKLVYNPSMERLV